MNQADKRTKSRSEKTDLRGLALGGFHDWPKPELLSLNDNERERYRIKFNAMKLYCEGAAVKEIVDVTGLNRQMVYYYVNRCMALAPDGAIWGCRALLPNLHIKAYTRTAEINAKLPEAHGGHAGALRTLFAKYPGLEEQFEKKIFPVQNSRGTNEYRPSAKTMHKIFLQLLKENNVPVNGWPFNTKYCGSRTIAKYFKERRDQRWRRVTHVEGESEAKAHLAVGKGDRPTLVYTEPFDAVEIDAYKFDCHSSVQFKTPSGCCMQWMSLLGLG